MRKKIDEKKWRDILSEISENVTEVSYRSWFSPLIPMEIDDEAAVIYFATSKKQIMEVLEMRYIPLFERAVESIYKKRYKVVVKYKTENEIENELKQNSAKPEAKTSKPVHRQSYEEKGENEFKEEYFLNPRYNFDNFIVGDNNRYAHAVAYAVAESPAVVYNPLFIYGGSRLGKTHLMNAIGHYILEHNPSLKVLYVSSEMFTSELIKAIQDQKNSSSKLDFFKNKYRNADVLLIDDIQFLEGKDATQVEFFHTFNTLYEAGRQIVFTADRPPKEMLRLDDRLRTRFEWGLPVDIQPPDYETRVAIIKNKAIRRGMNLPDPVLQYIAENITSNVRQIEGTVNKILAFQELMGESVDVDTVTRAVRDMFKDKADFLPSPDIIIDEVSKFYNIDADALRGQGRTKDTALARQIAMYQIRRMTNLSLKEIGKEFEGRDHTTVMHSIDRIEKLTKTNPEIAEVIKDINANINARYE